MFKRKKFIPNLFLNLGYIWEHRLGYAVFTGQGNQVVISLIFAIQCISKVSITIPCDLLFKEKINFCHPRTVDQTKCFPSFFSDSPASELYLELLLLQVVVPALLEQGHTRQWLKNLVRAWCIGAAWVLEIRSYLLGDVPLDDQVRT